MKAKHIAAIPATGKYIRFDRTAKTWKAYNNGAIVGKAPSANAAMHLLEPSAPQINAQPA